MKIRRKDFTGQSDNDWYYYIAKIINGASFETDFIEEEVESRYINDNSILKAIRDFCPLEYLDYYRNKYFNWLYGATALNIFCDRENFTKDFCIIDIPKDTFSNEETDILTNILRRCGTDFGLVVRKLDTHTLCTEWKKEYILAPEYDGAEKDWKEFGNKFYKEDDADRYNRDMEIEGEIENNLIQLIREKISNGETVFTGNNIGEKKKNIKITNFYEIRQKNMI